MVKVLLLTGCILATLAAFVACSGDSEPATAPTAVSPVATTPGPPTPATLVPSGTPATAATAASPTTAVMPTGTPAPTPVPTVPAQNEPAPTPTRTAEWQRVNDLLYSLSDLMEGMGLSLEVKMTLEFQSDGELQTAEVGYIGDALTGIGFDWPTYSSGELTIELPSDTVRTEYKYAFGTDYLLGPSGTGWEGTRGISPIFAHPIAFVYAAGWPIELADVHFTGQENIDGVETDVYSATSLNIPGARGDFDIWYWFGQDDGLMRKVQLRGDLSIGDAGFLARYVDSEEASVELSARFFDYGKDVAVATPELPHVRYGHQAILLEEGDILMAGGFTGRANNNVIVPFPARFSYLYSSESGLWSIVGQDSLERQEISPTGLPTVVRLSDGRILAVDVLPLGSDGNLVTEGSEVEGFAGAAFLFDTESSSWQLISSNGNPRLLPILAALSDGRVLIVGGLDPAAVDETESGSDAAEIFDPTTGEWKSAAPMLAVVGNRETGALANYDLAAAVMSDGRVMTLAPDGVAESGGLRAQVYDPNSDTWEFTEPSNLAYGFTAIMALSDGRVMATGLAESPSQYDVFLASEIYDPATGQWTDMAEMNRPRLGMQLTLLPDGRVVATGGDDNLGDGRATTEVYDPATSRWSPGPPLSELRSYHSATLLPGGRILLAGGIALNTEIQQIYETNSTEHLLIP